MHGGGNGMTCFIRCQRLSNLDRRSFLPSCSSRVFNMPLMLDQYTLGFCVLSSVDSLCISMISSFKTHFRGLPGFLFWFIELKLSDLRFKDVHALDSQCTLKQNIKKQNPRMKCPNCGHWNRVPANKVFH